MSTEISGSRARREKEKENMKSAILEAAIKIIAQEGYHKLSMRKIADAIEYTPTTIYSYYKDKAEIISDISRQIRDKIISDVRIAMDENRGSPLENQLKIAFKAFLYSIADCSEMGSAVIKSGMGTIFGPEDEAMPPENNGILMLHGFLELGQQQGIFRKLDNNISWMLVTALIGFGLNSIENKLHLNENWPHLVEVYTDMLVKGLLPGRA